MKPDNKENKKAIRLHDRYEGSEEKKLVSGLGISREILLEIPFKV